MSTCKDWKNKLEVRLPELDRLRFPIVRRVYPNGIAGKHALVLCRTGSSGVEEANEEANGQAFRCPPKITN